MENIFDNNFHILCYSFKQLRLAEVEADYKKLMVEEFNLCIYKAKGCTVGS